MQNTEGVVVVQTGQPRTKQMEHKEEDRLGKNDALQGSVSFFFLNGFFNRENKITFNTSDGV